MAHGNERLQALFESEGLSCHASTGTPLSLHTPEHMWWVAEGQVDVFLTRMRQDQAVGARHPLFRVACGSALLGLPRQAEHGWGVVAVGHPGHRLLQLPRQRLQAQANADAPCASALRACTQRWIDALQAVSPAAAPTPRITDEETPWKVLDACHSQLLLQLPAHMQATEREEQDRWAQQNRVQAQEFTHALLRLGAVLEPQRGKDSAATASGHALLDACRLIGQASGLRFAAPSADDGPLGLTPDALNAIVEASQVRTRPVTLQGPWWNADHGPLLAWLREGMAPVALLHTARGYVLHNPAQGTQTPVTPAVAAGLHPNAQVFYRPFAPTAMGWTDLLRFGSRGCGRDFAWVLFIGLAIGVLGMLTPMATGLLFDTIVPSADKPQWMQLSAALMAAALATAMFEVTRGLALLRVENRMDSTVQAAVWDRLLRLPTAFFRGYSAGDLAVRANGINAIRQALSGNALQALMALAFSLFNLGLLFYYNAQLAWWALALVVLAVAVTTGASLARLHYERQLSAIEGRISGVLFQFLGGIAKLRTTGSQGRAFTRWALLFAAQQEQLFKATMVRNALGVFHAVFPALANLCIFALIAFHLGEGSGFSTGSFLAFNAAFGGLLGAMLGATGAITAVLDTVPLYERARPILRALPQTTSGKAHPGRLRGDIELNQVSLRYTPDGPLVVKDLSLHIRAGEFVAIVGPSGSGKSSLLRLLLGFESPSTGAIYYDQQDLGGLDLGALRRQIGVVLQNGQPVSGDMYSNIVGSATSLTLNDAWEAAAQAGLAQDIRAMPMGMHTVVSDGGGTLSGGQRQRLLIARAIAHRPRVLFFDEATSALDNQAQATVSASLERLQATRVVIAHRLSTIVHADRICVIDQGQLVQEGTYEELARRDGLFAELVRRQTL